jgi:uncharacterized protein YuzE
MEKNFKVSYDEVEDLLYIGRNGKVKFSIDIALPSGDVVVDMGSDNSVKGIEIFNATKFFSLMSEEIKKIRSARINTVYSPSYTALTIDLGDKTRSNLVIPYTKRLIRKA